MARKKPKPKLGSCLEPSAPAATEGRPGEPPGAARKELPKSKPDEVGFIPENLDTTIIAVPLLQILKAEEDSGHSKTHPIIIDPNLNYPTGRMAARERIKVLIAQAVASRGDPTKEVINIPKSDLSQQYLFCRLSRESIRELVRLDGDEGLSGTPTPFRRAIHHIWPDFQIKGLINKTISTVKADAAHRSFSALGDGIIWAVIDSGIDGTHAHFAAHKNLLTDQDDIKPRDLTGQFQDERPLRDVFGHGTHVAGIIAGEMTASEAAPIRASIRQRDEKGDVTTVPLTLPSITGMAPRCKLLSLKVLNDEGDGEVSSIIAALETIQEHNGYGRRLLIHGVNLSVGYEFFPEWFACGRSPLCVEVNRLVKSGVVVVVAAGNSGYGTTLPEYRVRANQAGFDITINDPGNAELAITVGSTHRNKPHVYGVSYFSSKGPTGDGRYKPDLVAPGEKIVSCRSRDQAPASGDNYKEDSGTSMAAPHVSGVIAAFLSVRSEFLGQSEEVKKIFMNSATDLNRERYFQGMGLVDLMRAIQSV
jgi:serine protease AprX